MLRLKFTPAFSHPSLSLRQLLCALRSPARRARDPMLQLQSKFTPDPSFDLRLALFFQEPLIRHAHSGWCPVLAARGVWVVLTHLRFAWCSTPPTAIAYTTRFCFARLSARFGHIILSCGGQFEGNKERGIFDRTVLLSTVRDNMRRVLVPCCNSTIRMQELQGTATVPFRKK